MNELRLPPTLENIETLMSAFTYGTSNPDMHPQERGASAIYDKLTPQVVPKYRLIRKRGDLETSCSATKDLGGILGPVPRTESRATQVSRKILATDLRVPAPQKWQQQLPPAPGASTRAAPPS
ncbi:hypothetical protein HPB47_027362 [Ixodes persulcatus]|uniref:Uncharacterized protein n=1 Tax=Ixodes persulcatus TaxID=34615 RepID=A0AC60PXT9_IXOPE|nr:hypothetical protein HPB47_027362 [Ixodes persulcatus]